MEAALRTTVNFGLIEEVRSLLSVHPDLDVNSENDQGYSALHTASDNGLVSIIELLLAHPAVNVNLWTQEGRTPFLLSCEGGDVATVRLLLQDLSVDTTLADTEGCTPLWKACYLCQVKWWSGWWQAGGTLGIWRRRPRVMVGSIRPWRLRPSRTRQRS